MEKKPDTPSPETDRPVKIPVWDLPTRLFHWLLVILGAVSLRPAPSAAMPCCTMSEAGLRF